MFWGLTKNTETHFYLLGAIMTVLTLAGKVGALVALAAVCSAGAGAIFASKKAEATEEPKTEPPPADE